MGQIKNTIQKQIASNAQQKYFSTSGTILEYDRVYNTATVRFLNPNGEGYMLRRNVPVSSGLGGLSNNGVFASQQCTLSFVNGNLFAPIIIGITSSTYTSKDTSDQGAFLIDESVRQAQKPDNITPMVDDWLDEDNLSSSKYDNDLCSYANKNINNDSYETLMNLSHYSDTETGITHLTTHSSVKMRDNGDIDLFVADNVGIRISQSTHKIYLYGFDVSLNGEYDLMEIINMIKNFKCKYEPTECKCDMEFIRQSLNAINAKLQSILDNPPNPGPHKHNISDATIELAFENNGRLNPTTRVETVRATIIGGDADDGCPVEKKLLCSGAKSITKVSDGVFNVVFDEPGFYVFIAVTEDEYEELRVGTATTEITGIDGERSGSGQFIGTLFDSGWIDVDILNGCYIDSYSFKLQVQYGHNCYNDRIGIIGKKTDGTQVIIRDLFNPSDNSMRVYNGDLSSLVSGNLESLPWEGSGSLSLSDDIRQIKFTARTDYGHEDCMPGALIEFNMTFKYDKSLWQK